MRRQTTSGDHPAGSGRTERSDPPLMQLRFYAPDARADGRIRQVELNRKRVVLRRSLHGMRMAISMPVSDFSGIVRRTAQSDHTLVLAHRDPSLSIPLLVTADADELDKAVRVWCVFFALPEIADDAPNTASPAPRRRRHNAVKWRHPRALLRRRTGGALSGMDVYRGEREIIARD
ncbi:MAG: DUF6101 family protein [Xanthobacteraceae bacterium]